MTDYLIRAISKDAGVRGLACISTAMAQEGARRHETAPAATAVLGEALTGAALLGALLKVQHRIAIKFEGSGAISKILVESDSYGRVRGYVAGVDPELEEVNGRLPFKETLGEVGVLTVVKDLKLKDLAESVVPTDGGEMDEELTFYLTQSEQIPSSVEIDVALDDAGGVTVAGGLLLQAMPPYDASTIGEIQSRIQELPPMDALLSQGETPESILARLFDGFEYDVLEKRDIRFECQCSRERSEKALITLGVAELEQLLETEGEAVVDCHFCHERYLFDATDLRGLIAEMRL